MLSTLPYFALGVSEIHCLILPRWYCGFYYTEQVKLNFKINMARASHPYEVETEDVCWKMSAWTSITNIVLR